MGSLSGLVIGLSLVIGFILIGVVAEVYYLLCRKKRLPYKNTSSSSTTTTSNQEEDDSCFVFTWKRPNINPSFNANPQEVVDLEIMGSSKDLGLKGNYGEEGGIEAEIMRMHNLCGPPRFLFTIKEESREDLESVIIDDNDHDNDNDNGKGSRTKRLSDLFLLSSPTHVITARNQSCLGDGFNNPLFEAEMNSRLRSTPSSSPPPKLKFLRDAEDKLIRKLLVQEAERRKNQEEKNELVNRASQVLPYPTVETKM